MIARWFGVYLLTIGALTLFPFAPPACGRSDWTIALLPDDFVMNILMFIPAGIAVHRTTLGRTAALAFALSLTIEVSQQWLPRSPDVTDLASNTLGAIAGRTLARAWVENAQGPMMSRSLEHLLIRAAAALLLVSTLGAAAFNPKSDFSNWDTFPLLIGNDSIGDHGWVGELSELRIYDRGLGAPGSLLPASGRGQKAQTYREGAPILELHFDGATHAQIAGPDGEWQREIPISNGAGLVETTAGLRFEPSGIRLDDEIRDHVLERLRESNQLTVDARIHPLGLHQRGPAHILSFGGREGANLILAQNASMLVARLRTPGTVLDQSRPEIETEPGVLTGEEQHVRLTYDGYDALMFVDGECVDGLKLSTATSFRLLSAMLGGTLVLCCALTTLAVASFYRGKWNRILRGTAAGAAAWLALFALGAWDHIADFDTAALVLGVLAIAATVPALSADRLTPGARAVPG